MKTALATILALGVISAAAMIWLVGKDHAAIECPACQQDIASATYYAFNTMDCDGSTELSAPCQDELQAVTEAPHLDNVTVHPDGTVLINLSVTEKYGIQVPFWVLFEIDGTFRQASG